MAFIARDFERLVKEFLELIEGTAELSAYEILSQAANIERFNHTYREDVLDFYLFNNLAKVREITEQWMEEYNSIRPYDSLGGKTPYQCTSVIV